MKNLQRINFEAMPWEQAHAGAAQKIVLHEGKKLRLIRFTDDFIEEDWCSKAHVGFVVDGQMEIDFEGELKSYQKGDGFWILPGQKHKVQISLGQFVELILFEENQ